jgi:DNA-binding transcriptional ArsR family regulator
VRREPLPRQLIESIADLLWAVAEPNRIALLDALDTEEAGVQELADRVGLPHQNTSHHLSLLWRAGILRRRRLGNLNLYAIEDWTAWWAVQQIGRELRSGAEGQDVGPEDPAPG